MNHIITIRDQIYYWVSDSRRLGQVRYIMLYNIYFLSNFPIVQYFTQIES